MTQERVALRDLKQQLQDEKEQHNVTRRQNKQLHSRLAKLQAKVDAERVRLSNLLAMRRHMRDAQAKYVVAYHRPIDCG